jgi:hypothetical protein
MEMLHHMAAKVGHKENALMVFFLFYILNSTAHGTAEQF